VVRYNRMYCRDKEYKGSRFFCMYLGCLSSDETVVQWRFDTLISISVSVFLLGTGKPVHLVNQDAILGLRYD